MNEQQIIQWLWKYGHFRNPAFPETANVQESDLPKLTLTDPVVQLAVKSIQDLDANLARVLVPKHHQRALIADGDVGPATLELMFDVPRCGEPDYAVEEAGEGSWPVPGCDLSDAQRDSVHSVRFFVDASNAPSEHKAYLDKVLLGAQYCCAEAGLRVRYVTAAPHELKIQWKPIGGSTIGYFNILQRSTCQQSLSGYLDSGYKPEWFTFCTLLIHEALGHGIGHSHTSGGIMNPSISKVPPSPRGYPSYKIDGSGGNTAWNRMVKWFGGQEVPIAGGNKVDWGTGQWL